MSIIKELLNIGGIQTSVYKFSDILTSSVAVAFALHGRTGSASDVDSMVRSLLLKSNSSGAGNRSLIVVTMDHRNHGGRLVEAKANNTWTEDQPNEKHAMDMYSIQVGTAKDVSFLIDFLPSYLFPNDDHQIDAWGVVGISLGGHSTWLALAHDPRITVGIPIIGCPDYLALIERRAKTSNVAFAAPYLPASLIRFVKAFDPASQPGYRSNSASNPFFGKKVLVLSGQEDTLVPWVASEKFVEELVVGDTGVKKVVVMKGVGHACTEEMVEEAGQFLAVELCGNAV